MQTVSNSGMDPATSRHRKILHVLAAGALALAVLALFAGRPSHTRVTLDLRDLAAMIEQEEDHVEPAYLASLIMNRAERFRLIDLRDPASYAQYHLPGAELQTLSSLVETPWKPREAIILYSQGGTHASQAWFLLKARGLGNVTTLRGGVDLWMDQIVYPRVHPTTPPAVRDSLMRLSAFFGGAVLDDTKPAPQPAPPLTARPPVRFERERERIRDGC